MTQVASTRIRFLPVPLVGGAVALLQWTAGLTSPEMILMIFVAAMVHTTNMVLRDLELRALIATRGFGRLDRMAYGCSAAFDAYLLFGLIAGAGLLLSWSVFLWIALAMALIWPLAIYANTRQKTAPDPRGVNSGHLFSLVLFCVAALSAAFTEGLQSATGSQTYVWLVLLSTVFATLSPDVRITGHAHIAQMGSRLAMLVLLIWNYLLIA